MGLSNMIRKISVSFKSVGSVIASEENRIELSLGSEEITLRDLIEKTVEIQYNEEIERLDKFRRDNSAIWERRFMTQTEIHDSSQDGKVHFPKAPRIMDPGDLEDEVVRAINAFDDGAFAVFSSSEQLTNLNQTLDPSKITDIFFIRISPLEGG